MIYSNQLKSVALNRLRKDPIKLPLQVLLKGRIFLLSFILATYGSLQVRQVQAQKLTVHDVADLELRLASQQQQPQQQQQQSHPHQQQIQQQHADSVVIIGQIMNDEYASDFSLTEQTIRLLGASLEEFEQIRQASRGETQVSTEAINNPLIVQIASELEYIRASFREQFQPLIQYIIQQRPNYNLSIMDLAFRCERYMELNLLKGLAKTSSIYSLIVDVFSNELYTHCFKRKLAMLKLNQVEPSSILRQFVDIYLDLPVGKQASRELRKQMIDHINSGSAFKLPDMDTLIERHGKPESVANLVLDKGSSLSLGARLQSNHLIHQFKFDCENYVDQVGRIWSTFDQLAHFLSSSSNDLTNFNRRIQLVAPRLMYATTCGPLVRLADGR